MVSCPVCGAESDETDRTDEAGSTRVICRDCGDYHITGDARQKLDDCQLTDRRRRFVCCWLAENPGYRITRYNLENFLLTVRRPSFIDRADKLLTHIAQREEAEGVTLPFDEYFGVVAWCVNTLELQSLMSYLIDSQCIIGHGGSSITSHRYQVGARGWMRLDEISRHVTRGTQGFVAMWFDEDLVWLYDEVIAPAIADAGYVPHRTDKREYNDKVDDEIIAQIRRSKFLVADFTGHRGGVYFEAGFAKGLGQEVFWLCREDDLDELHFDIRQYNCISWRDDEKEELRRRLSTRIEAVLGAGPGAE